MPSQATVSAFSLTGGQVTFNNATVAAPTLGASLLGNNPVTNPAPSTTLASGNPSAQSDTAVLQTGQVGGTAPKDVGVTTSGGSDRNITGEATGAQAASSNSQGITTGTSGVQSLSGATSLAPATGAQATSAEVTNGTVGSQGVGTEPTSLASTESLLSSINTSDSNFTFDRVLHQGDANYVAGGSARGNIQGNMSAIQFGAVTEQFNPYAATANTDFEGGLSKQDATGGNQTGSLLSSEWSAYDSLISAHSDLAGKVLNPDAILAGINARDKTQQDPESNFGALGLEMTDALRNQSNVAADLGGYSDVATGAGAQATIAAGAQQAQANFDNQQTYGGGGGFWNTVNEVVSNPIFQVGLIGAGAYAMPAVTAAEGSTAGAAATIGAAKGAVNSLGTGGNPLEGALVGGLTAAAGSAAGSFGTAGSFDTVGTTDGLDLNTPVPGASDPFAAYGGGANVAPSVDAGNYNTSGMFNNVGNSDPLDLNTMPSNATNGPFTPNEMSSGALASGINTATTAPTSLLDMAKTAYNVGKDAKTVYDIGSRFISKAAPVAAAAGLAFAASSPSNPTLAPISGSGTPDQNTINTQLDLLRMGSGSGQLGTLGSSYLGDTSTPELLKPKLSGWF
jgi:hypothetical protein